MEYQEMLSLLRDIYLEHLKQIVPEQAYQSNPLLMKEVYLDCVYTDIMALGYNRGEIRPAIDDVMPSKMILSSDFDKTFKSTIHEMTETKNKYPFEILFFTQLHEATQNNQDFQTALSDIRQKLENLRMGKK